MRHSGSGHSFFTIASGALGHFHSGIVAEDGVLTLGRVRRRLRAWLGALR